MFILAFLVTFAVAVAAFFVADCVNDDPPLYYGLIAAASCCGTASLCLGAISFISLL